MLFVKKMRPIVATSSLASLQNMFEKPKGKLPKFNSDSPPRGLKIMKEVGRLWSQIKEDSLSIYREQARLDLERYKKEHEEFVTIIN